MKGVWAVKGLWAVLAVGVLGMTACTTPEDRLQVSQVPVAEVPAGGASADGAVAGGPVADAQASGAQTFLYVDESFDLFPNRQEQGEAWRLQALGRELQEAGLCPSSYTIDSRTDSAEAGRFGGGLYRVTYQGHC